MAEALAAARAEGVTAVAFGDLFLEDIRRYREERMAGTGLRPLFPLWGRPTRALAEEMIASGQKAVLTCVDPRVLARGLRGPRVRPGAASTTCRRDVDPCGENGEFHTFAWDGPGFRRPVPVRAARSWSATGSCLPTSCPRRLPPSRRTARNHARGAA